MSQITDHTPLDFNPNQYRNQSTVKRKILDQIVYPFSTRLTSWIKVLAYPQLSNLSFSTDHILFGDRGAGFISLMRILRGFVSLPTSDVLIQGCGLGQEALAWSKVGVSSCVGVDQFNFKKAWEQIAQTSNGTSVSFVRDDICQTQLSSQSFDIISSFAVWEHVKDFDALIEESRRLIKPKGVVMSAFGPLWYTFSGDHFSAAGGLEHGFNHLLLSQQDYFEWIDSFQRQDSWATSEESYFEIRRHIREGLFSYLKPREYIQKVEKSFTRLCTIAIISPESLAFRAAYPQKWQKILKQDDLLEEDLLIKGLIVFLSPRN
jgi:2-polyprenyl-3-methyl-5-hydroxy-6-metoxy-1,4-benzoquinol methylase